MSGLGSTAAKGLGTNMLTLEQRRQILEAWYHKHGVDSLLDLCAQELDIFVRRCHYLRQQLETRHHD